MFREILAKEIREHLLDRKFQVTVILLLVLSTLTAVLRAQEFARSVRQYDASVRVHQAAVREYSSGRDLSTGGLKIDRPPNALSIFVEGVAGGFPRTYTISCTSKFVTREEPGKDIFKLIFEPFDFATLILVVMTPLVFLFSYDAISGERERGTLRLLLANCVARDVVILAKIAGGGFSLILPFIGSLLWGVGVVISLGVPLTGPEWLRLGLMLAVTVLYLLSLFTLGILVSVATRQSSTSLVVLLFAWVILGFVVPQTSTLLASRLSPVPSKDHVFQEISQVMRQGYNRWTEKIAQYEKQHGNRPLFDVQAEWIIEKNQFILQGIERIEREYQRDVERQVRVAELLSRLSPTASFSYVMASLARTDFESLRHYESQLRRYKDQFADYANEKIRQDTPIPHPLVKIDLSEMPRFVPQEITLRRSIQQAWADIALLLIVNGLLFLLAYFSFLRGDVR